MCWLYSVPYLLVIYHLETLYLGGNNVRVVCERVWRIDQVCALRGNSRLDFLNWLASGDSPECGTRVKHVGSKSRVWESVKNWSSVCIKRQLATGSCDWLVSGDSPECGIRVKHVGSWRVRTVESLQDKKYSLAILLVGDWNSRLILVVSDSPVHPVLLKNEFSHSISYPTINTLIPTKCRKLLERILRDKA